MSSGLRWTQTPNSADQRDDFSLVKASSIFTSSEQEDPRPLTPRLRLEVDDVMLCRSTWRSRICGHGVLDQIMSSTTSWRYRASRDASKASHEVPDASPDVDKLDGHIEQLAKRLSRAAAPSIQELYHQYQHQAGAMIDRVVPYEETPHHEKRADVLVADSHHELEGDGLVLVVHVLFDLDSLRLQKTAVCSGFVVNAGVSDRSQGDVIVTCAHTLEEVPFFIHHIFPTADSSRFFAV